MKIRYLIGLAACNVGLLLAVPSHAAPVGPPKTMTQPSQQQTAAWHKLVDEYFNQVYLRYNPTAGTSAGLHQYDSKLETTRVRA